MFLLSPESDKNSQQRLGNAKCSHVSKVQVHFNRSLLTLFSQMDIMCK